MLFKKDYKSFTEGDWIIAGVPSVSKDWPDVDYEKMPLCVQAVYPSGIVAALPPTHKVKAPRPIMLLRSYLREHDFRAIKESDPLVQEALCPKIILPH